MSVKIPSSFTFGLEADVALSGIPTGYNVGIALQKINIGIDPLQLALAPIEIKPIDLSFRIKEIPSIRVHLPLNYCVGLAIFGFEILAVRLCGEGQVITEPYVPNPCECGYQKAGMNMPVLADEVSPESKDNA